jgi:hypothetical protein
MALPATVDTKGFAALFASLEGAWRIEKNFSDGSRFEGSGEFRSSGLEIRDLDEQGLLCLPAGGSHRAIGRWRWQLDAPSTLLVRYPPERGGAIYHRCVLAPFADGWTGSGEHLCGADVYLADYLLKTDEIIINHSIRGPRKALSISARHLRLPVGTPR